MQSNRPRDKTPPGTLQRIYSHVYFANYLHFATNTKETSQRIVSYETQIVCLGLSFSGVYLESVLFIVTQFVTQTHCFVDVSELGLPFNQYWMMHKMKPIISISYCVSKYLSLSLSQKCCFKPHYFMQFLWCIRRVNQKESPTSLLIRRFFIYLLDAFTLIKPLSTLVPST